MKNHIQSKIDDKLSELLKNFCKEKHWETSQAVREILSMFFHYEPSDNDRLKKSTKIYNLNIEN